MSLVEIYQCLCDETRLRLLNLLQTGPLCVCHLQEVLDMGQVAVSKHLGYLRRHGLVTATREGKWRIYRLVDPAPPELRRHLACLQDCTREIPLFCEDQRRLAARLQDCCPPGPRAGTREPSAIHFRTKPNP